MVHLLDAALDVAGVMGTIRLPVLAVGAPYGQAVAPTGVEISSVKGFEAKLRFEGHEAWVI